MTARRLKVVDFSIHFPGAVASQLLAQMGADVVKVENPHSGDGVRGLDPLIAGEAMAHLALNVGKRSLAISPRSPEWKEVVAACARWADVVLVGTRASSARRLGIDFESLRRANPRLVYCLITGYGETGPWANYAAHGLNLDALAGLVPTETKDGLVWARPDYRSVGVTLVGVYAAFGIMAGVWKRDQTGRAQYVSLSAWGAAMAWSWRDLTTYANLGHEWTAYQDLGPRYAMYLTADNRAVLVCPIEKRFWAAFCDVVGLPAAWKARGGWEANGMEFGLDYPEERAAIAERIVTQSLSYWNAAFERADIPFAPVLTIQEALQSDHARATDVMATTMVHGTRVQVPRSPVTIRSDDPEDESPGDSLPPPPDLGQHNEEILREILRMITIPPSASPPPDRGGR